MNVSNGLKDQLGIRLKHVIRQVSTVVSALSWRRALQPRALFLWDEALPVRASSTSWLDGLRGIASLQVYFYHVFGRHGKWGHTYGSTPEDVYLYQLPLFRIIWCGGSGAVNTFFVISGYVLTVKSLALLRRGNYEDLYAGLCSSVFRRIFRLYLPLILLAIPTMFLIYAFSITDLFMYSNEVQETLMGQFVHLLNATDNHINPFAYKDQNLSPPRYGYVPSSWTIPLEWYGSIVCYVMVLIVSRIEVFRTRSIIVGGTSVYALHRGCWWVSNFLFGMLLADYGLEQEGWQDNVVGDDEEHHHLNGSHIPATSTASTTTAARTTMTTRTTILSSLNGRLGSFRISVSALALLSTTVWISVFVYGFYLTAMPPQVIPYEFVGYPKPGYEYLYRLYPPFWLFQLHEDSRWWWYWAGNLIVLSISQLLLLQSIFNTKFCQWLGRLSFPLYLVHPIPIALFSTPLQKVFSAFVSHKGILCFLDFLAMTPIVLAMSAVAERWIDRPSVRFGKWLESRYFVRDDSDSGVAAGTGRPVRNRQTRRGAVEMM